MTADPREIAAAAEHAVLSVDVTPHLGDEPAPMEVLTMAATAARYAVISAIQEACGDTDGPSIGPDSERIRELEADNERLRHELQRAIDQLDLYIERLA